MNFMRLPPLRSLLLGVLIAAAAAPSGSAGEAPKWSPHIDLEGRWGEGRSLGDVGLFAPLWQSQTSLLFTDIRLKYDNRDSMEGNFGLGLRHMLLNGWNLGVYGYFDRRRSGTGHYFNQATLGVEALSADWDLRANAYVPFGRTTKDFGLFGGGAPYAEFANGTIEVVSTPGLARRYESALSGADAEIGWRLPVFPAESLAQLRAYAGGYWFDGGGLVSDIYGPRGRVELSFDNALGIRGARFTLGGEVQRDRLRGTQAYAMARLRIPLQAPERDAPKLTAQEARMTERVVRDVDVVTGGHETTLVQEVREAAINTYNQQTITGAVRVDASSGQAALQSALDSHGAGGVVILNGNLTTMTASTAMSANGTLLGGGAVLPVEGATSGIQVDFVAPGAAGGLIGALSGSRVIQVASGSVLGGLRVENTSNTLNSTGIFGHSANGVTVFGSKISTVGANSDAINFDASSRINIFGNDIRAERSGADGIFLEAPDSTVRDNVIETLGGNVGSIYVFGSPNVTVSGNAIKTAGTGIWFSPSSANGTANDNIIVSQSASVIGIQGSENGLTLTGNTIELGGIYSQGIVLSLATGITVSGNEIVLTGEQTKGIMFATGSTGIAHNNSITATGSGSLGLELVHSSGVTVLDNAFGAIGGAVIATSGTHGGFNAGSTGNSWTGQGGGVLCNRVSSNDTGTVFFSDIDGAGTPGTCAP